LFCFVFLEILLQDKTIRDIDIEVENDVKDQWRTEVMKQHDVFLCSNNDLLVLFKFALVDLATQHSVHQKLVAGKDHQIFFDSILCIK
jgi:hypothetical protein